MTSEIQQLYCSLHATVATQNSVINFNYCCYSTALKVSMLSWRTFEENIYSLISIRVQFRNKYLDVSAQLQQIVDYQECEIVTIPPLLSNNTVCQMKLLAVPVSKSIAMYKTGHPS